MSKAATAKQSSQDQTAAAPRALTLESILRGLKADTTYESATANLVKLNNALNEVEAKIAAALAPATASAHADHGSVDSMVVGLESLTEAHRKSMVREEAVPVGMSLQAVEEQAARARTLPVMRIERRRLQIAIEKQRQVVQQLRGRISEKACKAAAPLYAPIIHRIVEALFDLDDAVVAEQEFREAFVDAGYSAMDPLTWIVVHRESTLIAGEETAASRFIREAREAGYSPKPRPLNP